MHRFAAVAVIDPRGRLLMQERGDDALHEPGRWGYPGGDLEAGEDFVDAAVRELTEETGLVLDARDLESLGVRQFRSDGCGGDDEFELFAVRTAAAASEVTCGEGVRMAFVDLADVADRPLHRATRLTLDAVREWHAVPPPVDFVQVALVDPRGRVLIQERDDRAPAWPDMWCLPGGGLEHGEQPVDGAARELAEETGVVVDPADLDDLGRFTQSTHRYGVFAARTTLGDDDVECHEGRQMAFVAPERLSGLDVIPATRLVEPHLRDWTVAHPFDRGPDPRRFAGIILVDRRGWILLQERDEFPRIDPEKWGLAGGHVDPGEDFEPAAHRELEEETGVRLPAGGLQLFREFVVDHREAYGTWDVMQVFVAATDLTDADIDCREGRQIVFVDPAVARGLDLSSAATDIVPAFLDSDVYASMAP